MKKVLILGGGFAGLRALASIHKHSRDLPDHLRPSITLVDKNESHIYQPALYEVATYLPVTADSQRAKYATCIPMRKIAQHYDANFIPKTITSLNPREKAVTFKDNSRLTYDYAVLALGATPAYYDIPGLAAHAYTLKNFSEAISIHHRLQELIETKRTHQTLKINIGGAGTTGVELAGELHFFLRHLQKQKNKNLDIEINLIDAAERILPRLHQETSRKAGQKLQKLGINIINKTLIKAVNKSTLSVKKNNKIHNIKYDLLIWTGGVSPNPLIENLPVKKDPETGKIVTDKYLRTFNKNDQPLYSLYAAGDNAYFYNKKTSEPIPATAWSAESQGELVGENITRALMEVPLRCYRPPRKKYVVPIGSRYAILQFNSWTISGAIPWTIKQLIELKHYLGVLPWHKALYRWLRSEHLFSKND